MSTDHSRFTLVDVPAQAPGACWITHTPQGPFIDTGVDVQFAQRGHIYLSVSALREMAEIAGLLGEGKSVATEVIEGQAYQRGYDAGVRENLSGNVDRIVDQLGGVIAALSDSRSGDVGAPEVAEAEPAPDEGAVDSSESTPDEPEPAPRQGRGPARKPRSNDVPTAAVDESFRI